MNSSSADNESGSDGDTINEDMPVQPKRTDENVNGNGKPVGSRLVELLQEEREAPATPLQLGDGSNPYKSAAQQGDTDEEETPEAIPRTTASPTASLLSIPDDTPSVQGSIRSSPSSSILPSVASRPGIGSSTPSFRPFDRRFQSRLSITPSYSYISPRSSSPAYITRNDRTASLSSQLILDSGDTDTPSPPWEVVRWTKLKKLNGQVFSETGRRNFGSPMCVVVAASIVLGTSKGVILIFDYHQNLKSIIGPGTKAVESGAITSVAISADHLIVAGGHANGSIFTWETGKAARPFLHIPSLDAGQMANRTMDGHVPNVAIRHLGFLGTRHTALISADDRGMAFSHLATRGMGAVGRSIKTTRILGRYPNDVSVKPRKPSTILAFAPLPLGNVERSIDNLGLTAMLTPYLLVIVSTTPVAQTQHKSARPKEVAAHSAMSGCLAWFPAVKLKVNDPKTGSDVSQVKLVYCWSNVLTVLDVEEMVEDKDKPSSLSFKPRSRWKAEEAIVAVQWLSRSVLTVLTITQRLIILEDGSMRMTEAFDLVNKHIFHQDLFSQQLHTLVEQLDEEDPSMHGVVADAFYMSFKAYKSRMFLLGFNDVQIGTLSNWADRLIAMMEDGDYIGAIQLATSYYTGDADKLTIGLPENTALRHSIVQDKLLEIITASLKFAFGQRQKQTAAYDQSSLKELADACFEACLSINDIDFLFDEAWEWYEDGGVEGIFLETLEPYILDKTVTVIPPAVVKPMITYFVTHELECRLEEVLCHMETATLDIDQVTTLCKQHNLYDALIYIWTQALGDYITPLIDLLTLLIPLVQNGGYSSDGRVMEDPIFGVSALKMFPYMSYTFTGRVYPTGDTMHDEQALNAKAEIYWFLFSGKSIHWPKGNKAAFLTNPRGEHEPSFPYLRTILKFDAPSFLSALNEAFEDSFLNDTPERAVNGGYTRELSEERVFGLSVNRQYIITILLEVMNANEFASEDTIYLDMFVARNFPKFPQYLLLSGTALHKVLAGLCNYPGEDLADDAQLSAEYLLSVYHPPDLMALVPLFQRAGFFRVLKSIYKADKQFNKLIETYFEDSEDREDVFTNIADCLRPKSGLTKRQTKDVHEVILAHATELVHLDPVKAAQIIELYAPALHQNLLDSVGEYAEVQYTYLRTVIEPGSLEGEGSKSQHKHEFIELYVQLMCRFDASYVAKFVETVQASDLHLDRVLPHMEESGVIDAAVVLMSRDGQVQQAMARLVQHLRKLEASLLGLLNGMTEDKETEQKSTDSVTDLLGALQKYTNVGIWLCQGQTKPSTIRILSTPPKKRSSSKSDLSPVETLWLDLIEVTVQSTQKIHASLTDLEISSPSYNYEKFLSELRPLVQRCFTALLTSTSTPTPSKINISFLRILRAFLTRASISSPNLSDLRAVLASIFSAYAYEESILSLANRLLEQDVFVNVRASTALRQRGWRPKGSTCEGCGRRAWGPGVAGDVFKKWEEKQNLEFRQRKERKLELAGGDTERGKGRVHTRNVSKASMADVAKTNELAGLDGEVDGAKEEEDLGLLIMLACKHIYHQKCLEEIHENDGHGEMGVMEGREFRCPIDG